MKIKKEYEKIVGRFNRIFFTIGCEHLMVDPSAEACYAREAYGTQNGITIGWMRREAEYWLSCYYEEGNCRCDERKEGPEEYKVWVRETGYLKRLIKALEKYPADAIVEEDF